MKRESERWDYSCSFASPTTSRPHGRAGEFPSFRRRKAGRDPHDDHVMGIWIHRGVVMEAPARLALGLSTGETLEAAVTESFGLSGIAEPVCHHPATRLLFLDEE